MMMMRRNRGGFKLGRKIIRVFKWVTKKRGRSSCKYQRLEGKSSNKAVMSKLCKWGKSIKRGLSFNNRGYIRVGQDPDHNKKVCNNVPKGYLAVYVGEKEEDCHRVLVPVLFLNHPLFGKLLKEAEDAYGFDHPGQITIPCPISEFEYVKTKIASGEKCRPFNHMQRSFVPGVKCLSF